MGAENFIKKLSELGESKRLEKRVLVLLSAKLQVPFGDIDVRLRDISAKGALVECAQRLPVGSEVIFKRRGISISARVAWSGSGKAGLEFRFPVNEKELLVQLGKSSWDKEDSFQPHALKVPLDENVQKLARAWGVTVGINLPGDEF